MMYCTQKIKISEDVMQKKNIFRSGILLSGLIAASIIAGGCAKKEQKKALSFDKANFFNIIIRYFQ